jgi:glucosyl-3-phosphoglycerate phosphatase
LRPGGALATTTRKCAAARPRLILARHGRTAWNAEGLFQGKSDPPLDDLGLDQARRLAVTLLALSPELVVASDLIRAAATASPLASAGVKLVASSDLREVDLGEWEGLGRTAARARFPDEYDAWSSGQPIRRGGGETPEEAGTRAAAAVEWALRCEPGLVVVISHGLVLQAAMGVLARGGRISLSEPATHLGNGEFVAFCSDGSAWSWHDPNDGRQTPKVAQ